MLEVSKHQSQVLQHNIAFEAFLLFLVYVYSMQTSQLIRPTFLRQIMSQIVHFRALTNSDKRTNEN